MDGRTWLKHPETGGAFRCPDEAVEDWKRNGWVSGDPPAEVNPAIAERIAYEQAAAAAADTTTPTKAARRGKSQEQ